MAKSQKKPTVDSIMRECQKEVHKGLGRKRLNKAANDFWKKGHRPVIQAQVNSGADWLQDRKRVLPVSKKLGKVAAALTTGMTVQKWAAEAAHVAVKSDPGCPPIGAGGYCDF